MSHFITLVHPLGIIYLEQHLTNLAQEFDNDRPISSKFYSFIPH
jgi:hypothetical protein